MRWSEFLDCGKRLSFGPTEGDWRSAVSRAYYAVFHFFREWLVHEGIDIGAGAQTHNSLYTGFWNCGIPMVRAMGSRIDELRRSRTQTDYELRTAFRQAKSSADVREAELLINDFQMLMTGIPTVSVVQGVKKYLVSIGRLPKTP